MLVGPCHAEDGPPTVTLADCVDAVEVTSVEVFVNSKVPAALTTADNGPCSPADTVQVTPYWSCTCSVSVVVVAFVCVYVMVGTGSPGAPGGSYGTLKGVSINRLGSMVPFAVGEVTE